MVQKVLITGSNGFIGSLLVDRLMLDPNYDIIGLSKGRNRNPHLSNTRYLEFDLSSLEGLSSLVMDVSPDIIIHTAALSQVDNCELHPELCHMVNTLATERLVKIIGDLDGRFIFFSTDFVFDGKKMWPSPLEQTNPISVYAKSKLAAEVVIQEELRNWAIIRPVLVYGYSKVAARNNIFSWVFDALKKNVPIKLVTDQLRTPTYVDDVLEWVEQILDSGAIGIFHIAGTDMVSIYDFALKIGEISGNSTKELTQVESQELEGTELRPRFSCFKNTSLSPNDFMLSKGIDEGIRSAIAQISK